MEVGCRQKKKKNVAVLYFSATGTTKATAKRIKKKIKGKLIEIKAENPYTEDDLDYSNENSRMTKEHESASTSAKSKVRPEIANLKAIKKAIKKADVVYIGYPAWWMDIPIALESFLDEYNFSDKTVIPFTTHVSSGPGDTVEKIQNLIPEAEVLPGIAIQENFLDNDNIEETLKKQLDEYIIE